MVNFTSDSGNVTVMVSYEVDDVTRTVFLIMSLLCFSFFFYFIAIMLKVFFTTPQIQENPRYVLFVHMLLNDMLYIISTHFIVVSYMHSIYFPVIVCFIIQSYARGFFLMTPYNLAVMSLERYIAICFPLRHSQLCTAKKAKNAIAVVWVIGMSLSTVNFITMSYFTERTSYSLHELCGAIKVANPIQIVISTMINIFSFTMVASIILYTYFNVLLVARKVGSCVSSTLKAGKTVLLHAFQLLLCMTSYISITIETYVNYMYFLMFSNYVLFMCVPRLLSPLIYGIRDEAFQKHIRKACTIICVCHPQ